MIPYKEFPVLIDSFTTIAGAWDARYDLTILDEDLCQDIGQQLNIDSARVRGAVYTHEMFHRMSLFSSTLRDIYDFNSALVQAILVFQKAKQKLEDKNGLGFYFLDNAIACRRLLIECLPLLEALAHYQFEVFAQIFNNPNNLRIVRLQSKINSTNTEDFYKDLTWIYEESNQHWLPSKIVGWAMNYECELTPNELLICVPYEASPIERFRRLMDALHSMSENCRLNRDPQIACAPDYMKNPNSWLGYISSATFNYFQEKLFWLSGLGNEPPIRKPKWIPWLYQRMLDLCLDYMKRHYYSDIKSSRKFRPKHTGLLLANVESGKLKLMGQYRGKKLTKDISLGMMHLNLTHLSHQIINKEQPYCLFGKMGQCGCSKRSGKCGYAPYIENAKQIMKIIEGENFEPYEDLWRSLASQLMNSK